MNLTCPNCGTRFKIEAGALGTKGRKVKCGMRSSMVCNAKVELRLLQRR